MNIFLIGPMGVGKTTVGRCLATILNLTFKDSDQEIVPYYKLKIRENA
jgi:shikimate kinase